MDDKLQGKLVDILTGIQTAVGKASDFALGQLPDVAQSYVLYGRVSSLLETLLFVSIVAVAAWACVRAIKWEGDTYDITPMFLGFGGFVGGLVGLVCAVFCVEDAMLVWLAPKVWLLKALAHFLK